MLEIYEDDRETLSAVYKYREWLPKRSQGNSYQNILENQRGEKNGHKGSGKIAQ